MIQTDDLTPGQVGLSEELSRNVARHLGGDVSTIARFLLPKPGVLVQARAWNIAFRTAHIGVTGILLGGHVFDVGEPRLRVWLYLALLTGVCLTGIEAYPGSPWFYQGRGVCVLAKLLLLTSVAWLWDWRVAILALVVVIASVGSHMPARYRYYSFVHRQVLD